VEAKLQRKIISFLKENRCYVIKTRPQPGVPVGCPDIVALKGEKWLVIEVKALPASPFQNGQEATLKHLKSMNKHVYAANTENWPILKDILLAQFL
jgi:Holliday junction resolvase